MKYDLSILFYLKRAKADKKGLNPIYLRITVNGERSELSANRKIELIKWDSIAQRAKGRSDEAKALNTHLDQLETKIKQFFNSLNDQEAAISADILHDLLVGKHQRRYSLVTIFEMNNKLVELEKGMKYSESTINQYKTTLDRVKLFILQEYGDNDIDLSSLDVLFIRRFEIFLKTKYNIEHNTIMKHLKQLKKVVHFAQQLGYIDKDPFMLHQTAFKQGTRESLTQEELGKIETHTFKINRLERVKDVFLFICYTGLSYSDLAKLSPGGVTKGIDGKNWIIYNREKTGIRASVPMLPQAQEIINKYKNDPDCLKENKLLPVISNQRLNSYLSEIATICEIEKWLTCHVGRHTFATTVTLTNGVPIETVSKMLAHASIKTTQIYAQITPTKISRDMEALAVKLQDKLKSSATEADKKVTG